MPAKSEKQKQFMDAAAHNPVFAKTAGVPVSVAKEFSGASKGMKFGKDTNTSRPDLQKVNKPKTLHGKMSIMKEGGNTMASKMNPGFMAMMAKKKDGMHKMPDGKMMKDSAMKMSSGGTAKADMKQDKGMMQKAVNKHEGRLHKGATMTKLSKGGGIESKGKTKGKMITMNMGGKAC